MSRLLAIVAAIAAVASAALAQTPAPAPAMHPGTRLNFPSTLGGASLERSEAEGGGAVYLYGINKMQIYVILYDGGRRVPPGSDSPALMTQFTTEVNQAAAQLTGAGYHQFERPTVPSACAYGSVTFRCIVYSVHAASGRLYSKLLMTGYHDYFLKIRIDWASGSGQTQADADKALQAFVPALVH